MWKNVKTWQAHTVTIAKLFTCTSCRRFEQEANSLYSFIISKFKDFFEDNLFLFFKDWTLLLPFSDISKLNSYFTSSHMSWATPHNLEVWKHSSKYSQGGSLHCSSRQAKSCGWWGRGVEKWGGGRGKAIKGGELRWNCRILSHSQWLPGYVFSLLYW